MLDVMLPRGGYAVVQVETYFDESGSHKGSPVLCVAGYAMGQRQAVRLTEEWNGVLRARNLPYFRMSDCAHGNGPFANLSKFDRIQVQTRMIQIIKQYTFQGFAVTLNEGDYHRCMPVRPLIGSPYSFAANVILAGLRSWLEVNSSAASAAYFFEAGHPSQTEANNIMSKLFAIPERRLAYRYAGHTFVDKKQTPAVQAADLLAWQWYTDKRHQLEGRQRRKDCASLMQHHHNAAHVTPVMFEALAKAFPEPIGDDDETLLTRLIEGDPYPSRVT